MGFVILLLFISIPAIEIYLFIEVGDQVGAGMTVALTLLTAAIGMLLVRAQGLTVLRRAQASVERGEAPLKEALDGLALLVAGICLMIPGFFTDSIGALLLIPLVREAIGVALLAKALVVRAGPGRYHGSAVDGEYEDITPQDHNPHHQPQPRSIDDQRPR